MFSNANNSSSNTRGALVQNNRFECLNESSNSQTPRSNDSGRSRFSDSYDNRSHRNTSGLHSSRYSFLTNRNEEKKLKKVNLKTTRFPSLIDLNNIKQKKVSYKSNYMVAASYTEEQLHEIQKEKEKQKKQKNFEGWVQIQNKNGTTVISELNKSGKKKTPKKALPEEYDHGTFQENCAEAMYMNLKFTQNVRDEENDILGLHSRYYDKGSLTDLSYLSDSDVERSSDDNNSDNDTQQDYYSDCDTY